MRKTIKLPAPQLSQLKEVNIDLDMNGSHYALLCSSEGQVAEDVALSILKDLMVEDANKLTMAELRYLFMLVKINSLENEYTVSVQCNHENKGKICNHINKYKVFLSDADLNPTPEDYKIPKISWRTAETECEYEVIPPTMDMESSLFNYFQTQRNATPDDIPEDKKLSFDYTFLRAMMHLVKNGERLVTITSNFDDVLKLANQNKYSQLNHLFDYVLEVDSFGVQNKLYEFKCEECGGTLMFQLPLLDGLTD